MKMYFYTYFPCLPFVCCPMWNVRHWLVYYMFLEICVPNIYQHTDFKLPYLLLHVVYVVYSLHVTRNVGCPIFKMCHYMMIHWINSCPSPTSSVRCHYHCMCLKGIPYVLVCSDIIRALNSGSLICAICVKHIEKELSGWDHLGHRDTVWKIILNKTHLKEAGCKDLKLNELLEIIKSFSKLYNVF